MASAGDEEECVLGQVKELMSSSNPNAWKSLRQKCVVFGTPMLSCPVARLWPNGEVDFPVGPNGVLTGGAVSNLLMKWVRGGPLGPEHWFLKGVASALDR